MLFNLIWRKYKMQILIVDDDKNVLNYLTDIFNISFSESEVEINYANNFISAEQQIVAKKFDVITLDGFLADQKIIPLEHAFGKSLIPIIKEHSPNAIIISISGDDHMNSLAMEMGANIAYGKREIFSFIRKGELYIRAFLFNEDFSLRENK